MDITAVDQTQYVDLFPETESLRATPKFGGGLEEERNVLSTAETTTKAPETSTTESTTVTPDTSTGETTTKALSTDILGTETALPAKVGRPAKKEFSDLSGYFEDRLKSGRFVKVSDVDDQGNEVAFVPKTAEEFDEVIDLQVNYQIDKRKKELDKSWYQSKSPAWQAVAKYAELTDDPSEILPFLQGVKTIDSVQDLDPKDLTAAERIVRSRMEQKGDSPEIIDEQIESLKTTEKLVSTAEKYKPLILQEEKTNLSRMVQQKQAEDQEYNQLVVNIRDAAIKAIEAPIFGKQKLKQDEKAAIYDLIAIPSDETQGYQIYTEIDNLFAQGDFETLKQVALLLSKRESFYNYASSGAVEKNTASLQRQLRIAAEGRPQSKDGDEEEQSGSVQRNKYTGHFGRTTK